jgi:hypothetical protein
MVICVMPEKEQGWCSREWVKGKGCRYEQSECVRTAPLRLGDVRKGLDTIPTGAKGNRTLEVCFVDQRDFRLGNIFRAFVHLFVIHGHFVGILPAVQV